MKTAARFSRTLCLCMAVLISGASSDAQNKPYASKGVLEIGGGISFSSITPVSRGESDDATTIFGFGPRIGYFVIDGFQIGFNPGLSFLPISGLTMVAPDEGDNLTLLQLFAYPGYAFRKEGSTVFPFIEVPVGYTSASDGDDTQSGLSWGVRGGVKFNPAGALLVTLYAEYFQITINPEGVDERYGLNYLSFGVGVGGFF